MDENTELNCGDCAWRKKSEENPKSFMSWLWRVHTKFCPGWREYTRRLREKGETPPDPFAKR
ncbi:MAG: hypothetical protein GF419_10760 [Ignavibacteriales bacterium]|nr:hypothetical protein [Ignavibacteriales bacterium]